MAFSNPLIWEDLPDMEVIRLGETYYLSASSFHFSPGAPLLRSTNLVDWEYIGHSVPELNFGERFHLNGQHTGAYVKGIWASTLRYRESNGLFYWYGPIQGTESTHVFTAKDPAGPWIQREPLNKFYYDLGLLIDDDDTMYLAYGTKTICVAQLSADGLREVRSQVIYIDDGYLEGARMYKINGAYYIWATRPCAGQYVLKSTNGPFGPYECRRAVGDVLSPVPGAGHPHQGALIDTPGGSWFYMAFMDGYPGGRIPILAPVTFDSEGWPTVEVDDAQAPGTWKLQYPHPLPEAASRRDVQEIGQKRLFRHYQFDDRSAAAAVSEGGLDHHWEWNHCPDKTRWSIDGNGRGLSLEAATVTHNLYLASNTLTQRIVGPRSIATFCLDASEIHQGDRAGVSMFRYDSAYIGVHRLAATTAELVMVDDLRISPFSIATGFSNGHPVSLDLKLDSQGTVQARVPLVISQLERLWLRIKADVMPAHSHGYEKENRHAFFEYSIDGQEFTQLGPAFSLNSDSQGFVGYRFAIFNFATIALGGRLLVKQCTIESW